MSYSYGAVTRRRYVIVIVVIISLLYLTERSIRDDPPPIPSTAAPSRSTISLPHRISSASSPTSSPTSYPETGPCAARPRVNATLLMLARNSDLLGALSSVSQLEERFNKHCNYPWVFLNDEPFTDEFKSEMSKITNGSLSFGLVSSETWLQPDWIDETLAKAGREKMVAQDIIYADSVPYRNMCRFNSGFFFKHPLVLPYRYYWRVEPEIEYFCDITNDPFNYMVENHKIYGFTISFYEWEPTIPTLWSAVKEFIAKYPQYVADDNSMAYLSDDGGQTYNLCHFWSNFEIADMDFWRGRAYQAFFDFLEAKGGFYYERWGDAPVHSIAVALFAPKAQLHFFQDIGYRHSPFQHCPQGPEWESNGCGCDPTDTLDYREQSCIPRFQRLFS